jgi:hypothetical protein
MVRRLDEIARSIERVMLTLETSYVRRDVYEAKHEAVRNELNGKVQDIYADLSDIKETRKADLAFRRQILAGASVGIILLLINLVIATSNFIARTAAG